MENSLIKNAAKKTFIGYENAYNSVEYIFPESIDQIYSENYCYVGIKNIDQIPKELLKHLQQKDNYILHTIDSSALGGRAIDIQRLNPISGKPMTGSSSGTAINVLLGINDLGIGTDGGGSVLAPAMSVNMYGFISKLICPEQMKKYVTNSTDNIYFSPAIGYITRSYSRMKKTIENTISLSKNTCKKRIGVLSNCSKETIKVLKKEKIKFELIDAPDIFGERKKLMDFLKENLSKYSVIISEEGPIDYYGPGDSVFGHMGDQAKKMQRKSGKGLLRVINMIGATALTIPKIDFSSGYLLITESKTSKIKRVLDIAEIFVPKEDELLKRYFQNSENYFNSIKPF